METHSLYADLQCKEAPWRRLEGLQSALNDNGKHQEGIDRYAYNSIHLQSRIIN